MPFYLFIDNVDGAGIFVASNEGIGLAASRDGIDDVAIVGDVTIPIAPLDDSVSSFFSFFSSPIKSHLLC